MPTARAGFGAAVSAGRIHAIGGFNSGGVLTTHETYEPATNTWSTAAPMPTARGFVAVASAPDGLVYAIGGGGKSPLATVEAYDPVADAWTARAPMPTARGGLAVVMGPDGLIYAIAGLTASAGVCPIVETYDPATDAWNTAPPIPIPVHTPAAAVGPNGLIYVIGGSNGSDMKSLRDVYSYDPTNAAGGWSTRAPLPTARSGLAAAAGPDGLVYAMGGFDIEPQVGSFFFDNVEAYAFAENDGASVDGIDVADLLKDLVGRTVGGINRGAGGGIIVGGHYIPIPPRSPVWSKILRAAQPYLNSGINSPQLAQTLQKMQPRPGRATRQPNLGKREDGKHR
jgi:hypothetical protein